MSVYRALLLSLIVLLSACGGGDPDEDFDHQKKIDPPNCSASSACK